MKGDIMMSETEEIETAVVEETGLQEIAGAEPASQEVSTDVLPAATQMIVQDDLIASLAANPNVDIKKMQAIIDMKIQMMNYQAECEYNIAWIAFRKELGPVVKNRENKQTNSMYADLEAVKKAADPLLAKHGFADRYEDEILENGSIKTTCEIVHEAGHSKRNSVEFEIDDVGIKGSVNKTKIHGVASAMTYGQRISLCRACGIRIVKDDDGNAAGREPITAKEMVTIREYLDYTDSQEDDFCKAFEIEKLENLNKEQLKTAMVQLKTKVKRQKKEQAKYAAEKAAAEKVASSCTTCTGKGFVDKDDVREPCPDCSEKVKK